MTSRSRVEIAQGELDAAERDASKHSIWPLVSAVISGSVRPRLPRDRAAETGNHLVAARLFGASDAARQRMGMVRFKIFDEGDQAAIAAVREALGENDFDAAWAEGAALSIEEAIAYALRGRGERKRADSGWASLTRAELDVVRLVSEGLGNKEVAARLFVSPRTVQAHLTHVYTKLGLDLAGAASPGGGASCRIGRRMGTTAIMIKRIAGEVLGGIGSIVGIRCGTEEPKYSHEQLGDGVEVRRYGPRIAAETTVGPRGTGAAAKGSGGWPATSSAETTAPRRSP